MSHYEVITRGEDGERVRTTVTEERVRELLARTSHKVDEAMRVLNENPGGQMNCTQGDYVTYVA